MSITSEQKGLHVKFVTITGNQFNLFGLAADGRVYKYIPENKDKDGYYAFWSKLTDWTPESSKDETH